jgi:hypothetical protein
MPKVLSKKNKPFSRKLHDKKHNTTKRNKIQKWIRKSNKNKMLSTEHLYSDSNMKLLVDPNPVESTWEDDDLVVQTLTIPLTAAQQLEQDRVAQEAFVASMREGEQYRAQQEAAAAAAAEEAKVAATQKKVEYDKLRAYNTKKYKKTWLNNRYPLYKSLNAFQKARVEKEFKEYMKKHYPEPLALTLLFASIERYGDGAEFIRFIQ